MKRNKPEKNGGAVVRWVTAGTEPGEECRSPAVLNGRRGEEKKKQGVSR